MGVIKQVLQKQIESRSVQTMNAAIGTIIRYYHAINMADITYPSPSGDGTICSVKAPISSSLGGLTSNNVKPGQYCTITFINNNPRAPLITGINDSNYEHKTCTDQGCFIADEYIRETVNNNIDIIPMSSSWLDEKNTWNGKYNCITDYSNFDATNATVSLLTDADKFSQTEVGLTNLETKSTLKMKDNGDIDIFVSDNVGIRISKKTHKIYLYGFDVNINGEIDLLALLKKCRDCEFNGYHDNTENDEIKDNINEYVRYIDGDIEELKKCIAYTKEITGDISYFASLDSAIGKFETMKKNYNEGKYNDSIESLQDAYGQIMAYYEYFEEELIAARERWGLV